MFYSLQISLRLRHIWVFPARANGDSRPDPGLLIEWQKRHGQWWAHVAIVSEDGHMVVTWRHESAVRPNWTT